MSKNKSIEDIPPYTNNIIISLMIINIPFDVQSVLNIITLKDLTRKIWNKIFVKPMKNNEVDFSSTKSDKKSPHTKFKLFYVSKSFILLLDKQLGKINLCDKDCGHPSIHPDWWFLAFIHLNIFFSVWIYVHFPGWLCHIIRL